MQRSKRKKKKKLCPITRRKFAMYFMALFIISVLSVVSSDLSAKTSSLQEHYLSPKSEAVSLNPLKGFLRMQGDAAPTIDFPYSLEFVLLPLSDVVKGRGVYDWYALENALNSAKSKGRNVVLRFFMDLPNDDLNFRPYSGIPAYLVEEGGIIRLGSPEKKEWDSTIALVNSVDRNKPLTDEQNAALNRMMSFKNLPAAIEYDTGGRKGVRPNYFNPQVQECILDFVQALGAYDARPEIAAIEAGLLGPWGEWNISIAGDIVPHKGYTMHPDYTGPKIESSFFQELMQKFYLNFPSKHILLRNAHSFDGSNTYMLETQFGFHNDLFGIAPRDSEGSRFMQSIQETAKKQWQSHPMGGELGPIFESHGFGDGWNSCFFSLSDGSEALDYYIDSPDYGEGRLDFSRDIKDEHTSWLLVRESAWYQGAEYANALKASAKLGYDFALTNAAFHDSIREGEALELSVGFVNRGNAPFYYDWPVSIAVFYEDGTEAFSYNPYWDIREVGSESANRWRTFRTNVENPALTAGKYSLRLRISNPMNNGLPIEFANQESLQDGSGWVVLGEFEVRAA
ncbi:MAG: DUF4832 domain-containing protein [Oscillospiraceae bacterium]|jgi:hypothetical protein|nr:DUF4832 domain-containing protein [Oscillospiraceae bacterium]